MKKFRKITITILLIAVIFATPTIILADNNNAKVSVSESELTDEYKEWEKLSDEEKANTIEPRKYKVEKAQGVTQNPIYLATLAEANASTKYDLRNVIPNNIIVKDQQGVNACWAFAATSSLETNLAMANYKNNTNASKVYDFSERHMAYSSTRNFANGGVNPYGFNTKISNGGTWKMASSYLTNGSGAVDESSMPFVNSEDDINLSEIQNKTVTSEVYDTVEFPDYQKQDTEEKKQEVMNSVKKHIQNYGSVYAPLHADRSSTEGGQACYNSKTASKYCNDSKTHPMNHAISIIGWDDNYSKDNFAEGERPSSNGAWIAKNSWGNTDKLSLTALKNQAFENNREECINNGYNSAEEIPNDKLNVNDVPVTNYKIEGDTVYIPIAGNGYIYISYEDCNVSNGMCGIVKATDKVNYKNIYQYDELGTSLELTIGSPAVMVANIFDKKDSDKEFISQVGFQSTGTYTYKVYVNPNGPSTNKNDLQLVQLRDGESETVNAGYHTFEFEKPIRIRGSQYAVVVEIDSTGNDTSIGMESRTETKNNWYDYVKTETGKCFLSVTNNLNNANWVDMGKLTDTFKDAKYVGDSTIKAFTVADGPDDPEPTPEPEPEPKNETGNNDVTNDVTNEISGGNTSTDNNTTSENTSKEDNTSAENNTSDDNRNATNENTTNTSNETRNSTTGGNTSSGNTSGEETKNRKPQNSDFSKAKANITNAEIHAYIGFRTNYILMNVVIDDIDKGKGNDSNDYYYYISSNANEKDIDESNWTKITDIKNTGNKLEFEVNTKDMKNVDELSETDMEKVYIYIKEVSSRDGNTSTKISDGIEMKADADVKLYVEDQEIKNDDSRPTRINTYDGGETIENNNTITPSTTNTLTDNTTAKGILPHSGRKSFIIIILIVATAGILIFIRYKKISKYLK